ncbi:MAG: acetyltransferase [Nitrospirae bacterium]|nr:acetyltransferase [Nitrospirota bacterium]
MNKVVLLGGGGHAKVLIELIMTLGIYKIEGILDPYLPVACKIAGIDVLGGDNLLSELRIKGIEYVCIAVGSTKDNTNRKYLYEKAKRIGFNIVSLIHPISMISPSVRVYEGVQIMAGVVIQSYSSIGCNAIINTGAIIEHDCKIGEHVHVCPGAVISGGCTIKECVFIGAGSTIIQGVTIGSNSTVGAGAVVINDIDSNIHVMGVPAI